MLNLQGNNYTPPTIELVAAVDCDCGQLVPLHESYLDCGQDKVAITTKCSWCAQHWTTTVNGRTGGLRATCAGINCDCAEAWDGSIGGLLG